MLRLSHCFGTEQSFIIGAVPQIFAVFLADDWFLLSGSGISFALPLCVVPHQHLTSGQLLKLYHLNLMFVVHSELLQVDWMVSVLLIRSLLKSQLALTLNPLLVSKDLGMALSRTTAFARGSSESSWGSCYSSSLGSPGRSLCSGSSSSSGSSGSAQKDIFTQNNTRLSFLGGISIRTALYSEREPWLIFSSVWVQQL